MGHSIVNWQASNP